jgi:hypothetical protein
LFYTKTLLYRFFDVLQKAVCNFSSISRRLRQSRRKTFFRHGYTRIAQDKYDDKKTEGKYFDADNAGDI